MTLTVTDRFWTKVHVVPGDACWQWRDSLTRGYGHFYVDGRRIGAHRFSYELANGPIPEGMVLDHACHVPETCDGGTHCPHRSCVNPAHLEVTTRRENRSPGRTASPERRRTHCIRGHEFTEENTYLNVNKRTGTVHRQCRECNRLIQRSHYDPAHRREVIQKRNQKRNGDV